MRALVGLAAVNFFLADVQGGLGPFLATWLASAAQWDPARVGLVMTISGLIGLLCNTPAGALVDRIPWPRGLLAVAAAATVAGTLGLLPARGFPAVLAAQLAAAAGGALMAPALVALTLALVGKPAFARQQSTNQAWNHAGNVAAAGLVALATFRMGAQAAFWVLAGMAAASAIALLLIPSRAIDPRRAAGQVATGQGTGEPGAAGQGAGEPGAIERGATGQDTAGPGAIERDTTGPRTIEPGAAEPGPGAPSTIEPGPGEPAGSLLHVLRDRRVLALGLALLLFHLGNAAMLPLLGQRMAEIGHGNATRWLAACVIVAQVVMVPVALVAGRVAARIDPAWLLLASCIVLPIRGVLAAVAYDPVWLLPVQVLDACGAGTQGVVVPILVANYTWGSGRTQTALGAVATLQGIGAALSTTLGGVLAASLGWGVAFLGLSVPALFALGLAVRLLATRPAVVRA
jgi:predicted MFS family arabinose efflux permease